MISVMFALLDDHPDAIMMWKDTKYLPNECILKCKHYFSGTYACVCTCVFVCMCVCVCKSIICIKELSMKVVGMNVLLLVQLSYIILSLLLLLSL